MTEEHLLEVFARAICRGHFARKQYVGCGTKEQWLDYRESCDWKNFLPDARILADRLYVKSA